MASLPEGKSRGFVFSAAACRIQAGKRYIECLPLVPKDNKKAASLKVKGLLNQLFLDHTFALQK